MSESFEEWMRRQMGEPSEEAQEDPYTPAELVELLERYNLPSQAMLLVFERVMPVWRALARLREMGKRFEQQGLTGPGFRHELEALIVRQITLSLRDAS
jgi:hypothetical protein